MDELMKGAGSSKKTDFTRQPGFELLSLPEKDFFYTVKPDLNVSEYFAVKYSVQRQQWKNGSIKKSFMMKQLKEHTKQKKTLKEYVYLFFRVLRTITDAVVLCDAEVRKFVIARRHVL